MGDDGISLDAFLGICIKDAQGRVLQQNKKCVDFCGQRCGSVCKDGCMKFYDASNSGEREFFDSVSMRIHRNVHGDRGSCDVVVIHSQDRIISILYSKERLVEADLLLFKRYGLTDAERTILLMILDEVPNSEIAKRLFISLSTVKKHINNLYRKLPEGFRKQVSRNLSEK